MADGLAAQNGGVRPNVVNLAIDCETSTSFFSGAGRVPPVTGRTDAILASENLIVPEPASWLLMSVALVSVPGIARRRTRSSQAAA